MFDQMNAALVSKRDPFRMMFKVCENICLQNKAGRLKHKSEYDCHTSTNQVKCQSYTLKIRLN